MIQYLVRRLLLLPITLLCILFVNFVILNLAPGSDPSERVQISETGDMTRKADEEAKNAGESAHLQFREHFGLTLPIFFNLWPSLNKAQVRDILLQLITKKKNPSDKEEMKVKDYNKLRVGMGDKARYVMPELMQIAKDPKERFALRQEAMRFLVRGGTMQGIVGVQLSPEQREWNRKVAEDNFFLRKMLLSKKDSPSLTKEKVDSMEKWVQDNTSYYRFKPSFGERVKIFFLESRFMRYLVRVCTLDFGSLRSDRTRPVIHEVAKRFKYSLTLAFLPMLITFFLCQILGFWMAIRQNRWPDYTLNILTLILYATPVFVVAPFLIEKVALYNHFPFTDIPIPLGGFSSSDRVFSTMSSSQRIVDIALHLFLPLIAIMYGSLASQARLSRTAVLEVLRQDYVRTAKAKGCSPFRILFKHVGRNASITIVTSLASSLGIILGGSLIVETIFEIDGFGRFFYEAIINRDMNVVMFSALIGSVLALIGYLLADIAYTLLDPRVTLGRR